MSSISRGSTVRGTPKPGIDFPVISFLNYGWILTKNIFSALLSAVVFGRSLDSPKLKSQIL